MVVFSASSRLKRKQTVTEAITAKKGKARLLLDKAEEVLCYGGEASKRKHELFLEKLEEYRHLAELSPVIAFYRSNKANGVEKALKEFESVHSRGKKPERQYRVSNPN